MKRDKGYKLPDIIDPGQAVCIQVLVPSDPMYIAAFWQSYEFLSKWLAWEESGSNNAKAAADVWRPYFYESRDRWLLGEGSCNVVQPGASDNGEVYFLDILWGIKTIIEWIDQWLDDGKSAAEIKTLLAYLAPYIPGISELVDSMAAESAEDRQAAIDAFDWEFIALSIWCEDICDLSGWTGALGFLNWVECCIQKSLLILSTQVDLVSHWIDDCLTSVSIATGISVFANIVPGGGELFGFDPFVCPWELTYDFTLDDFGFAVDVWGLGDWVEGTGWVFSDDLTAGEYRRGIRLTKAWSNTFNVREIDTYWASSKGTFAGYQVWVNFDYFEGTQLWIEDSNYTDGVRVKEWDGNQTGDDFLVQLLSCMNYVGFDGSGVLTKLVLRGVGDPPEE